MMVHNCETYCSFSNIFWRSVTVLSHEILNLLILLRWTEVNGSLLFFLLERRPSALTVRDTADTTIKVKLKPIQTSVTIEIINNDKAN
jgi:hypothetical protein